MTRAVELHTARRRRVRVNGTPDPARDQLRLLAELVGEAIARTLREVRRPRKK